MQNAFDTYNLDAECIPFNLNKTYSYSCSDQEFITEFFDDGPTNCTGEALIQEVIPWDKCHKHGHYYMKLSVGNQTDGTYVLY